MTAPTGALRPLFPAGFWPACPLVLEAAQPANPPSLPLETLTQQHPKAGLVRFDHAALITCHNQPLAWIQPGNYQTQRHQRAFIDVAYVRNCRTISQLHQTGSMLDSESFDTEAEALTFIEELLAEVAA